jgi:transcriptional/translational regulatory protein YebC/TACO1
LLFQSFQNATCTARYVAEVLTDNLNRAAAETRTAVGKGGGKMADSGSVLFNFERKGIIVLDGGGGGGSGGGGSGDDKEEVEMRVFELATEAGADDVAPRGDGEEGFTVNTSIPAFIGCQRALADAGFAINPDQTALKMIPLVTIEVDDETADANDALVEKLLELDDIDAVYTQCTRGE